MVSLADQVALLVNPMPVFQDPEDDVHETAAQVVDKFQEGLAEEDALHSQLRAKAVPLLSDSDKRYAGKKVTRHLLQEPLSGGEPESESDGNTDDRSSEGDDIEHFKEALQEATKKQEHDKEETESLSSFGEPNEFQGSDVLEDDNSLTENDEQQGSVEGGDVIQKFSQMDVSEEIEKGKATVSQLALWDALLEVRIKLQKLVVIANRLPQYDTCSDFKEQGGNDYNNILNEGQSSMQQLLESLWTLQTDLLQQNPECRNSLQEEENKLSSDDVGMETSHSKEEEYMQQDNVKPVPTSLKRKLPVEEYPVKISKRHSSFINYRNSVIHKWDERTRLSSRKINRKSLSAFEQSAVKQIEQILTDKDRLIKRTRLKRTAYKVLGKPELVEASREVPTTQESLPKSEGVLQDYDNEVFDDDDFYHQLLRELIERRTANVTESVALSRQWLEIQRLRSKIKKKVDTKASKGRRIRYDIHPKLVNFMVPVDTCIMSDEAINELYSSLFGKTGVKQASL